MVRDNKDVMGGGGVCSTACSFPGPGITVRDVEFESLILLAHCTDIQTFPIFMPGNRFNKNK